jgi:hypothetical protein
MSIAMRQLFHFASETCAGCMVPASFRRPSCSDQQLRQGDAAGHVGHLDLRALRRRDRAVEQDALLGVFSASSRQAMAAPIGPQVMP